MKEIKLSKRGKNRNLNLVALVDDQDYEWLNKFNWAASKCKNTFYAVKRSKRGEKPVRMHRLILGLTDPKILSDHEDRNGLNNQRSNLRICTRSQNNANRTPLGSSKYLGVFFSPNSTKRPWYSRIVKDKKPKYLGSFVTEQEAAIVYNKAAIELHGEFANLNKF